MSKLFLPDVNIWLALTFDAHVHHAAALAWLSALADDEAAYFCRTTQQGFLRLSNNPQVFPGDAVTTTVAWQLYDMALSDPRVSFADEPVGLEAAWRPFTHGRQFTPKLWNDAYLAAFAQVGGYEVVTFDHGLAQYKGVHCTVLV